MPNNSVVFSVRPIFIVWIHFLERAPINIFISVWVGFAFGALGTTMLGMKLSTAFILAGVLTFIVMLLVTILGAKLNYSRTEYRFYPDRLEFDEGFFSLNKKSIKITDVKEVTLQKGIFQRIYGLGTIYLATLATGATSHNNFLRSIGFGNVSASGVSVRDIRNPDEAFEKIRAIVDARSK